MSFVPNKFKIQEMFERAVEGEWWILEFVSDQCKTQELCNEAVEKEPKALKYLPYEYKTERCVKKLLRINVIRWNMFLII